MAKNNSFSFQLQYQKQHARAGVMTTPHGQILTPIFMPVGTLATIKGLDTQDIESTLAQIILGNTYHLYLTPGMAVMQAMGGIHQFMGWNKPILTDSGGFQVFSLGKQLDQKRVKLQRPAAAKLSFQNRITDEGVAFTSHRDGSAHFFTPEKSIEIQRQIGADIIMAFDECTPDQAPLDYARQALDRTHAWAKQCYEYWQQQQQLSVYGKYQALFGIVQGALHPELRRESTQVMVDLGFDGIAFGGETIGYNMAATTQILDWVRDLLPDNKPRYAMGMGRDPQNIIDAVLAGYDMFDCVAPTRLARNGTIYHGNLEIEDGQPKFISDFPNGRLQIGNEQWKTDDRVIQDNCDCWTCRQGYSRAYLRHLSKVGELTYYRLASIHNVRFMVRLTEQLRKWISEK